MRARCKSAQHRIWDNTKHIYNSFTMWTEVVRGATLGRRDGRYYFIFVFAFVRSQEVLHLLHIQLFFARRTTTNRLKTQYTHPSQWV